MDSERLMELERVERFMRVVGSRAPRRHWLRVGGMVVVSVMGLASFWMAVELRFETWLLFVVSGGMVFLLVLVNLLVKVATDRAGEILTLGALKWSQRGKGLIEVELLGGGKTWREDLRRMAVDLLAVSDEGWRGNKVVIVTAVFPAGWMRRWGFDVQPCGKVWAVGYEVVYRAHWWRWVRKARREGEREPRRRKRGWVVGRHRMGPWMDVVRALPAGLR